MDVCLRGLKERNKIRFDSYSVGNTVLITSHITFPGCRVHSFCNNPLRNTLYTKTIIPFNLAELWPYECLRQPLAAR